METTQPRVTPMADRHKRLVHAAVWVSVHEIDILDLSLRHDGEVHVLLAQDDSGTVDRIAAKYDQEPAPRETLTGHYACNYSVRIPPDDDRDFAIWITSMLTAWPVCRRCEEYAVDHPGTNCPTCTTAMGALEAV